MLVVALAISTVLAIRLDRNLELLQAHDVAMGAMNSQSTMSELDSAATADEQHTNPDDLFITEMGDVSIAALQRESDNIRWLSF